MAHDSTHITTVNAGTRELKKRPGDALVTSLLGMSKFPEEVVGVNQAELDESTLDYLGQVEGKSGGDATDQVLHGKTFPYGLTADKIRELGPTVLPNLFIAVEGGKPIARFSNLDDVKSELTLGTFTDQDWRKAIQKTIPYYAKKIPKWDTLSNDEKVGALSHTWNTGNASWDSFNKILKADKPDLHTIKRYITNSLSKGRYLKGLVNRRIKDLNRILLGKNQPIITNVSFNDVSVDWKATEHTVTKGESLSKIAKMYDISLAELRTANPEFNKPKTKRVLHPKDKLKIPESTGSITKMSFVMDGKTIANDVHNKLNRVLEGSGSGYDFTEAGDAVSTKRRRKVNAR